MLRVVVADDEARVCQLILMLADWDSLGMEVVGTAGNGLEALELVERLRQASRETVDQLRIRLPLDLLGQRLEAVTGEMLWDTYRFRAKPGLCQTVLLAFQKGWGCCLLNYPGERQEAVRKHLRGCPEHPRGPRVGGAGAGGGSGPCKTRSIHISSVTPWRASAARPCWPSWTAWPT